MVHFEGLADLIGSNMVGLGRNVPDPAERGGPDEIMVDLWRQVRNSVALAVAAVRDADPHSAREILLLKDEIERLGSLEFERTASTLGRGDPGAIELARKSMSFADCLRDVYSQTKRIAYIHLPVEAAREEI